MSEKLGTIEKYLLETPSVSERGMEGRHHHMSRFLQPEPGMEIYDPTCGSGGLLVECEIAME